MIATARAPAVTRTRAHVPVSCVLVVHGPWWPVSATATACTNHVPAGMFSSLTGCGRPADSIVTMAAQTGWP
jgi:hypothetical protein